MFRELNAGHAPKIDLSSRLVPGLLRAEPKLSWPRGTKPLTPGLPTLGPTRGLGSSYGLESAVRLPAYDGNIKRPVQTAEAKSGQTLGPTRGLGQHFQVHN